MFLFFSFIYSLTFTIKLEDETNSSGKKSKVAVFHSSQPYYVRTLYGPLKFEKTNAFRLNLSQIQTSLKEHLPSIFDKKIYQFREIGKPKIIYGRLLTYNGSIVVSDDIFTNPEDVRAIFRYYRIGIFFSHNKFQITEGIFAPKEVELLESKFIERVNRKEKKGKPVNESSSDEEEKAPKRKQEDSSSDMDVDTEEAGPSEKRSKKDKEDDPPTGTGHSSNIEMDADD